MNGVKQRQPQNLKALSQRINSRVSSLPILLPNPRSRPEGVVAYGATWRDAQHAALKKLEKLCPSPIQNNWPSHVTNRRWQQAWKIPISYLDVKQRSDVERLENSVVVNISPISYWLRREIGHEAQMKLIYDATLFARSSLVEEIMKAEEHSSYAEAVPHFEYAKRTWAVWESGHVVLNEIDGVFVSYAVASDPAAAIKQSARV